MNVSIGQLGRTVRFSIGRNFFDRESVLRAVDKATRSRLSRAGSYVWRRSKTSMRKARRKRLSELDAEERRIYEVVVARDLALGRPKPRPWWFKHSEPGQPPRWISKELRDHIYFAWDDRAKSVVVGPALLSGSNAGSKTVPEVLEFGGVTTNRKGRRVAIAPRPFMRPALAAEQSRFPELFRNSVR